VKVTVYEAYTEPAGQVGSFLSLASNGLRVLRSLGVLEQVQRVGIDVPGQRMWSSSGKLLGEVPRGRMSSDDLHSVTLMRGALVEVLRAEALAAGAVIVTSERLVDVLAIEEGVRAVFASGLMAEASLLIGADGMWSATWSLLDPDAPIPEYAGLHRLDAVPVCHNDCIALLGDAGHPVGAGHGASMALEDALVLAQSLAEEPSAAAALSAYETARSARMAKMTKAASDNRDAKTAGPLTRRMRDLVMPLAVRLFYEKATAWLYTHDCGQLPTSQPDGESQV
jgi:2-polyprenyl-6-methoxyphenol hydroxylase and related FAD-dependent oxidoreductases